MSRMRIMVMVPLRNLAKLPELPWGRDVSGAKRPGQRMREGEKEKEREWERERGRRLRE